MSAKKSGQARRERALKALTAEQTDAISRMQGGYEERIARQVGIINRFQEEIEMLKTEATASLLAVAALVQMHGAGREPGTNEEQISGDLLKRINIDGLTVVVAEDGSDDVTITYSTAHEKEN